MNTPKPTTWSAVIVTHMLATLRRSAAVIARANAASLTSALRLTA